MKADCALILCMLKFNANNKAFFLLVFFECVAYSWKRMLETWDTVKPKRNSFAIRSEHVGGTKVRGQFWCFGVLHAAHHDLHFAGLIVSRQCLQQFVNSWHGLPFAWLISGA